VEANFMATNRFENSRISEGTLHTGAQREGSAPNESRAVSRDDVRDGFAGGSTSEQAEASAIEPEAADMIAEGGPVQPDRTTPSTTVRLRMPCVAAASTLVGHRVLKSGGEELGHIEEIMLDLKTGRIAYAVLSFSGFPGIANKRFPVPWNALQMHLGEGEFVLDMDPKTLEGAPDFDKDNWPDMADPAFGRVIHKHYGTPLYREQTVKDAGDFSGKHIPDRGPDHERTAGYQSQTRH
jgi:sporulation protein YlmC with PRC-barrel domain